MQISFLFVSIFHTLFLLNVVFVSHHTWVRTKRPIQHYYMLYYLCKYKKLYCIIYICMLLLRCDIPIVYECFTVASSECILTSRWKKIIMYRIFGSWHIHNTHSPCINGFILYSLSYVLYIVRWRGEKERRASYNMYRDI